MGESRETEFEETDLEETELEETELEETELEETELEETLSELGETELEKSREVEPLGEPAGTQGAGIERGVWHEDGSVDFDFDARHETPGFRPIPPGTYLCRVDEARPGLTQSGHRRWALKYVVDEGAERGRVAAWDQLAFSPKAAGRARQVLAALGLQHKGRVRLSPFELVGRVAWVTVEKGVYRNPTTGVVTKRNQVPYNGVRPAADRKAEEEGFSAAEMPF